MAKLGVKLALLDPDVLATWDGAALAHTFPPRCPTTQQLKSDPRSNSPDPTLPSRCPTYPATKIRPQSIAAERGPRQDGRRHSTRAFHARLSSLGHV
eukprot:1151924-Pelagomonas_calceolata.AAC.2